MAAYTVYPIEEQEKAVEAFFEAEEISFEKESGTPIPEHVIKGIAEAESVAFLIRRI